MNGSIFTPICYEQFVEKKNSCKICSAYDEKRRHEEAKSKDYEYSVYHQCVPSFQDEITPIDFLFAYFNLKDLNERYQVEKHIGHYESSVDGCTIVLEPSVRKRSLISQRNQCYVCVQ